MKDSAIQMALALAEAIGKQVNHELLAVDLHSIRHRLIDMGQDDAAQAVKLLVMAVMLGR